MERGNLFVIPLDDKRQWYRYHHLFAEVLRAHLLEEQPGLAAKAIHHALAAEDFERAADLVELTMPAMRQSRQEATLLDWFQALPDELFRCRPVLSVHYAGTLLQTGQFEGVEVRLRDAERWLNPTAGMGEVIFLIDELVDLSFELKGTKADFLLKPFALSDLMQKVWAVLEAAPE